MRVYNSPIRQVIRGSRSRRVNTVYSSTFNVGETTVSIYTLCGQSYTFSGQYYTLGGL